MQPYYTQPAVVESFNDQNGHRHEVVKTRQLENFKISIEAHISTLTAEMQTLQNHANWIEPRLHEFIAFNQWMEKAHPDIIDAYKKSTAVAKTLDKANHDENAIVAGVAL